MLYAGLKGVPQEQWEPLIPDRLQLVRLLFVADIRAVTYSGGMERRLSLVIATIGDPKIIFLDGNYCFIFNIFKSQPQEWTLSIGDTSGVSLKSSKKGV